MVQSASVEGKGNGTDLMVERNVADNGKTVTEYMMHEKVHVKTGLTYKNKELKSL